MLRRVAGGLGLLLAVVAYYQLRKFQTWGPVQDAVSYLPQRIIAAGPIVGLAAWILYVLPERVTRRLGQMAGLKRGIPEVWLAWASWLAAPLVVYYLVHMASDATRGVYGGIFVLCLFALMAKELSMARARGKET